MHCLKLQNIFVIYKNVSQGVGEKGRICDLNSSSSPPPMALSDQATLIKGDSVAEPAHEITSA